MKPLHGIAGAFDKLYGVVVRREQGRWRYLGKEIFEQITSFKFTGFSQFRHEKKRSLAPRGLFVGYIWVQRHYSSVGGCQLGIPGLSGVGRLAACFRT